MSFLGNLFGKPSNNINVVALKEKMESKPANVLYLDVRTPNEFKSKSIKGFKNIPVDQIPNRLNQIPKSKEIVLICQSGSRSGSAARFLKKNGYENIINVSGGMGAWMRNSF
jgi:rhodanese-related sulfurtransferase